MGDENRDNEYNSNISEDGIWKDWRNNSRDVKKKNKI